MLVLTRRESESVVIRVGDVEVTVVLVEADRGKVRLGFVAPRDVRILRSELVAVVDGKRESPR